MPPTISIWIRCHRAAAMVHRVVRLVAPAADEVVVAFETSMSDDDVALLAAARPDRLLALDHSGDVERAEAWVTGQCSGDWTLRLDFDEVPSLRLLRSLRQLISAGDVDGYRVPRLWTWPTTGRFLAQRPWWPDHQPRLLRVDAPHVRFATRVHDMIEFNGPERTLELPIYHLDLAISPPDARAKKAEEYANRRTMPDMLGKPFNQAYYLPERYAERPATLPVPDEDLPAIVGVERGPDPAPARRPWRIPTARDADIQAALDSPLDRRRGRLRRALAQRRSRPAIPAQVREGPGMPGEMRATLEVIELDARFVALEHRVLHVRVENLANWTWGWPGGNGVLVLASYHWRTAQGSMVVADGLRTPLRGPLPPNTSTILPVSVAAGESGNYILELDLLVEGVGWFGLDVQLPVVVEATNVAYGVR